MKIPNLLLIGLEVQSSRKPIEKENTENQKPGIPQSRKTRFSETQRSRSPDRKDQMSGSPEDQIPRRPEDQMSQKTKIDKENRFISPSNNNCNIYTHFYFYNT